MTTTTDDVRTKLASHRDMFATFQAALALAEKQEKGHGYDFCNAYFAVPLLREQLTYYRGEIARLDTQIAERDALDVEVRETAAEIAAREAA